MAGLIYTYDESLAGLLCCVYESYVRRELPEELLPEGTPTFLPARRVTTVRENALRVWRSLETKGEAAEWVRDGWLSCVPGQGKMLFTFIRAAFSYGASVCHRTADPAVTPVFNAVRAARHEAHMFCGFVRFSDYQGVLAAQISPKALVLPLLQEHFTDRFAAETFLIHDMTHSQALFYSGGKAAIREVDSLELEAAGETERMYRRLWRRYYNTTAIEGRYNPKCRMNQMSKRYWKHLTEFQTDEGEAASGPLLQAKNE